MDDALGQINRLQLLVIIRLGLLLFLGDINKRSQDHVLFLYVHNILKRGQIVLLVLHPLAVDALMGVVYPLEIHRVDKLIQIHIQRLGPGLAKILLAHCRVLHNLHVFVHDQHDIGRSLHDQIGKGL